MSLSSAELAGGYPDNEDDDENEEDGRMVNILESLDERSLDLLLSTIDMSDLDGKPVQGSLEKQEENALAYARVVLKDLVLFQLKKQVFPN